MTAHHSASGDVLSRVVTWLRAGYPDGVPEHDYVALFGILHRALTEQEVDDIARRMIDTGRAQASQDEIGRPSAPRSTSARRARTSFACR